MHSLLGLLWVNDQLVTEDAFNTTRTREEHPMPSVGFEPAVPEIKLQQTYAFVCTAAEISIVDI